MQIRIYLAGPLAVERDGDVILRESDFRGRQVRLALAYLLLERGRSVSRSELVALLWPEDSPIAWEAGLSAVISRVRQGLSQIPGTSFDATGGSYRVRFEPDAWVDIEIAIKSLESAEAAIRSGRPRDAFGPSFVACTISRRPVLADDESPWAEAQRARMKRVLVRSLEAICRVWIANNEPNLAVEAASDLITQDPLFERGYQLLMEAHGQAGNPAAAIDSYRRLQELFRSRLGIDPSPETEKLYQVLLG